MLKAIALAGLFLAQAATPAATPLAAQAPAPAAKPEKPKKEKLICRDEGETGSFITKRVCRTPEQMEAERVASRNETRDIQDRAADCRGRQSC